MVKITYEQFAVFVRHNIVNKYCEWKVAGLKFHFCFLGSLVVVTVVDPANISEQKI